MKNRIAATAVSAAAAAAVSIGLLAGTVPVLAESTSEDQSGEEGEEEEDDSGGDDVSAVELSIGSFTNTYTPDPGSAELEFTVTLRTPGGKDIDMTDGQFSFLLQEYTSDSYETETGDSVTVSSTAAGEISFDEIEYTKVGTYYYLVTQIEGDDSRIEYDDMLAYVSVTVTCEEDALVATINYPSDTEFNNIYAPDEVTVALTAKKSLKDTAATGRTAAEGEFSFELKDESGEVIDTASNDADGKVTFQTITYVEAGTYTYTVSEVAGTDGHISYDDTTKTVTVTVTEDENGALSASVSVVTAE